MMITGAIARPFPVQVNTGNHSHFISTRREYDTQALVITRISFHGIFVTARLPIQHTLPVVDGPVPEDFRDLGFIDMAATHATPYMFGIIDT